MHNALNLNRFSGSKISPSKGNNRDNSSSGSIIKPNSKDNMPTLVTPSTSTDRNRYSNQGQTLGGGGSGTGGMNTSDNLSARDRARLKWASANVTGSSSTPSSNSMLQSAKSSSSDTRDAKNSSGNNTKNLIDITSPSPPAKKPSEEEKTSCPVCQKSIELSKINDHLDVCLASSENSSKTEDKTGNNTRDTKQEKNLDKRYLHCFTAI